MRDLSKNIVDIQTQKEIYKLKSLYIAPAEKDNNLAVVIKLIDNYVYFIDGLVVYKSTINYDGNRKYFRFLNNIFYFHKFEKI